MGRGGHRHRRYTREAARSGQEVEGRGGGCGGPRTLDAIFPGQSATAEHATMPDQHAGAGHGRVRAGPWRAARWSRARGA